MHLVFTEAVAVVEFMHLVFTVYAPCIYCLCTLYLLFMHLVFTEAVAVVEFMHLVFTRMPGEHYRRRLRSLLFLCYAFRVLINSPVC